MGNSEIKRKVLGRRFQSSEQALSQDRFCSFPQNDSLAGCCSPM